MADNTSDTRNARVQGVADRAHGLVDQAKGTVDQVKETATTGVDKVAQAAHRSIDQAATSASGAVDWVSAKSDEYTRVPQDMLASTCDTIRAKPLMSVGVALAAGYLIGRLTR